MLQIILIIIGAIIAIILIVALLTKKQYSIVSEITINRPQRDVFNYVKNLRNQEKYSVWLMADPNIKLVYTGTDGTVGFKSSWQSEVKNVGVGEQEITSILEGEGYNAEIRFEKPFKGISYAHLRTQAISLESTKVTTTFDTKTDFPMNALIPMIKKMLQKDMDQNSANLKKNLENQG